MSAFILAVPRATKPLDPRYETNFVDTKRLFSVTLYVPGEASGSVPKKYIITAVILFLLKDLGIFLIPCGSSPFACQDQERKYLLSTRIQTLNPININLEEIIIISFIYLVN